MPHGHRSGLDLIPGGLTAPLLVDPDLIPVPGDEKLAGWLRAGARELVDTVLVAGPDRPVWNYLGVAPENPAWAMRASG